MRKIKFWFRLFTTFLQKFKILLLLGIVVGTSAIFVLPRIGQVVSYLERGKIIGIVGRYSTEDIPFDIQSQISMGLTLLDDKNNVGPGLAQNWEAQDEGKVWMFKLGAHKWQDGSNVLAKDINYQFSDVESEVISQDSIKFILQDPFAPFPSVVARPIFKKGLLGAGEWKVSRVSYVSGRFIQKISLINTVTGKKKTYKFYPTEEAVRTAFKLGEIESVQDVVEPREFATWEQVEVKQTSREDRYVGVFINTKDPIYSDKSLRQALAYAIDKNSFKEKRAISPISPNSWAFNPQVKKYEYNPQRAKELLETLPKEQREGLSINLVTTPSLLLIADKIKDYWEEVGVTTHIQVANAPPDEFQALLAIQAIPPDPDQYSLWHSTQEKTNIINYRDSKESQRIDKLLEDGRRILDTQERKKLYLDFQRFLVEESPVVFLFHPITYTIKRK